MTPEEAYLEKLKNRQRQEHQDKGKTGLGKKTVLDHTRSAGLTVNIWNPRYKPDKNTFDILPFQITQSWYKNLRMPSGRVNGLDVGDLDYKLQIPIHRSIGANFDDFVCLRQAFGGKCAICDNMFELYKQGDKKGGNDLQASWRTYYNIYDYDDPNKDCQLFEISYRMFESTTKQDPQRTNLIDKMQLADGGIEIFYDFKNGKTLVVEFKQKMMGKNPYAEVDTIVFEKREPYDQSILKSVYPLDSMLIIPTPEEVREAHYSKMDDEYDNMDAQEQLEQNGEEEPKQQTRSRRTPEINTEDNKEENTGLRNGGRRRTPEDDKKSNMDDVPPWDEDGKWGQCPAGKSFGKDCNSGPECEGKGENPCDEQTFDACLKAYEKMKDRKTETKEEPKTETRSRQQREETKEEKIEEKKQETTTINRTRRRR